MLKETQVRNIVKEGEKKSKTKSLGLSFLTVC